MKKVILIKLGGSVITDKKIPYTARLDILKRLVKQLSKARSHQIILGHGVGSFAHTSAAKYGGKKGYKSKWGVAKVARDAMEINRIVMDSLIEQGLPAVSLRPMSMIMSEKGELKEHLFKVIDEVIRQGLMPVVYGDVIWDKEWKSAIYSGERTLNEIGFYLIQSGFNIDKIIQVGQTNGVYDSKRKTIPTISRKNWQNIKQYIFKNKEKDVTGSMEHKIESALEMADKGIKTFLINGTISNELYNAILGKPVKGTIVK